MRARLMHHYWLLLVLLCGTPVYGATLDITAEYNPASYEVEGAKFINTTPCTQFPNATGFWCSTTATVDTPQAVRFDMNVSRSVKKSDNKREGLHYISFPGARDVTLVKDGGGATYTIRFFITAVGTEMHVGEVKGSSILERGDCSNKTVWSNNSTLYLYRDVHVVNQISGGQCYGNNDVYVGKTMTIKSGYLGYKLKAPNPLKMENGTYSGKLTLSIGNGKDIDFGNGNYTDEKLTVSFKVKVRHQIKVEFPSGSNKAVLQPPGGWISWIHHGQKAPTLLQQSIPFRLWSSADFSVTLRCQYLWEATTDCALKDGKGRTVPLKTYYVRSDNTKNYLTTKKQNFTMGGNSPPLVNKARAIQFQVSGGTVTEMMKYPGSSFKGDVTLIFDAAID